MEGNRYRLPDSTIYRKVADELVVIQLGTGRFYYFNPCTEPFLNSFRQPRRLSTEEAQSLADVIALLLQEGILEQSGPGPQDSSVESLPAHRPQLIRRGEKTLDEITFLCP